MEFRFASDLHPHGRLSRFDSLVVNVFEGQYHSHGRRHIGMPQPKYYVPPLNLIALPYTSTSLQRCHVQPH